MAEDWDLNAIVRAAGRKSSAETPVTIPNTTSWTTSSQNISPSCLATFTFDEEKDPFSFPNLVQSSTSIDRFQELNQLFTPFNLTTTRINPNSSLSHTFIRPHLMPESPSTSDTFHDQQQLPAQQPQQQLQHEEFQVPHTSSFVALPNALAQTPRSRKRKSQQKRMVCHVTAENLSADLWAWRKYGQKPIKGSPYPRNYYRCSSSKGCVARKQVERSTTEPDMFIVTYTGDHTHPRPTHRNSLAGSTRSKSSTTHGSRSPMNPAARPSSSSTASLSPRTLLTADPENEAAAASNNETQSPDPDLDMDLGGDDDILIPDIAAMAEDIFFGMDQFGDDTGEGGSNRDIG